MHATTIATSNEIVVFLQKKFKSHTVRFLAWLGEAASRKVPLSRHPKKKTDDDDGFPLHDVRRRSVGIRFV